MLFWTHLCFTPLNKDCKIPCMYEKPNLQNFAIILYMLKKTKP